MKPLKGMNIMEIAALLLFLKRRLNTLCRGCRADPKWRATKLIVFNKITFYKGAVQVPVAVMLQ
jgi:hypothetical protein